MRRANPLPPVEDETASPQIPARDGAGPAQPAPASLRPRRRPTATSGEPEQAPQQPVARPAAATRPAPAGSGATAAPAPGAALRPRRRPATTGSELAEAPTGRRSAARRTRSTTPSTGRDFEQEHVSPPVFVRQSVGELRKVIWPSGQQLGEYFVVVLAFVLFIIAFVGLLDLFFGWGLLKILGK